MTVGEFKEFVEHWKVEDDAEMFVVEGQAVSDIEQLDYEPADRQLLLKIV